MENLNTHDVLINGARVNVTEGWLREKYPEAADAMLDEAAARKAATDLKHSTRVAIRHSVGDTESILGTTADVAQFNAVALLALVAASRDGQSGFVQRFKDAIESVFPESQSGGSVYDQADDFLAGIGAGNIKVTAGVKGLDNVFSEMAERSTGVAEILETGADY